MQDTSNHDRFRHRVLLCLVIVGLIHGLVALISERLSTTPLDLHTFNGGWTLAFRLLMVLFVFGCGAWLFDAPGSARILVTSCTALIALVSVEIVWIQTKYVMPGGTTLLILANNTRSFVTQTQLYLIMIVAFISSGPIPVEKDKT